MKGYIVSLRFLRKYLRKYAIYFVKFYAGCLLDAFTAILVPFIVGIMIDEIVYYKDSQIIQLSGILVLILFMNAILGFLIYSQHHYIFSMFTFDIKMDVYDQLMKLDASEIQRKTGGEWSLYLNDYPMECVHFVVRGILHMFNNSLAVIFMTAYLVMKAPAFGIEAVLFTIFSALAGSRMSNIVKSVSTEKMDIYEKFSGWLNELLLCRREIKMTGNRDHVNASLGEKEKKLFSFKNKAERVSWQSEEIISWVRTLAYIVLYITAGWYACRNMMTAGTFLVIYTYYGKTSSYVEQCIYSFNEAIKRTAVIEKLVCLMKMRCERSNGEAIEPNNTQGSVEFKNINFSYGSKNVLNDVSFIIRPGEKVAVIGPSGEGKSTIAHILSGFFQQNEGEVLLDGYDISNFSLKSIRKFVGILEQEVKLFDGTIRENLVMGNKKASEEDIRKACVHAEILDFIENLQEGFDTSLSMLDTPLSGGQKQRIGLARLYLKQPGVMILDEATSALDEDTESRIVNHWSDPDFPTATIIIITHRKRSTLGCERVLQLKNGKFMEVQLS